MAHQEDHPALPRIYAWFAALVEGDTALMTDLLAHGLPVDVQHPLRRTTALMEATRLGRATLVSWLIERGASPAFLCGMPKGTPLHCAVRCQHWAIACTLLNYMVVASMVDGYGRTPLHLLCMELLDESATAPAVTIAEWIIDKGCPLDALDQEGITALHYCVINEHGRLAGLLLARGASPNVLTPDNLVSPLTIAALEKNLAMSSLLIEHGADPNLATRDGTTPAMLMPRLGRMRRATS